jgi:hypothetical protein
MRNPFQLLATACNYIQYKLLFDSPWVFPLPMYIIYFLIAFIFLAPDPFSSVCSSASV